MMRTVKLFCIAFWCLGAFAWAQNRQPCRSPPLTSGMFWVSDPLSGKAPSAGDFSYDSPGRRLRLIEKEIYINKTSYMDVLMLFEEGVFYEIDSKAQSCMKRPLQTRIHGMEVPRDATHAGEVYLGSASIPEQGIRIRTWTGKVPELGHYAVVTSSCGCLTVSCSFYGETKGLIFSFLNIETEVKDLQVFVPPSFCEGVALEEPSDQSSFFSLFL